MNAPFLSPFSGCETKCAKCGSRGANTTFTTARFTRNAAGRFVDTTCYGDASKEQLLRECRRCGFQWMEAPKVVGL